MGQKAYRRCLVAQKEKRVEWNFSTEKGPNGDPFHTLNFTIRISVVSRTSYGTVTPNVDLDWQLVDTLKKE